MIAIKCETKNYGDAMRLYYKDEEEYNDWIEKLKELTNTNIMPKDQKTDISVLLEAIEKRKSVNENKANKQYGNVNTLLFFSELSLLTTIFMNLVLYSSRLDTAYKDCEQILTNILDGKEIV